MSIKLMNAVWQSMLPTTDKMVVLALADAANDEGLCWPSLAVLERKTGLSKRGLQEILKRLEKQGIITREHEPGRRVLYQVHADALPTDDTQQRGCIPCTGASGAPVQQMRPGGASRAPEGCIPCTPQSNQVPRYNQSPRTQNKPKDNHHTARARAREGAAPVGASRGVCGGGRDDVGVSGGVMSEALAGPFARTLERIGISTATARDLAGEAVRRLDGERVAMLAGVIADRAERMERGDAPPITDPVRWVRTLMERAARGELSVPDEVAERVQSERLAAQVREVLAAIEAGARVLLAGREAEVERAGSSVVLRVDSGVMPLGEAVARGIVRVEPQPP